MYNKSAFLKQVLAAKPAQRAPTRARTQQPTAQLPGQQGGGQAGAQPTAPPKKEPKKFTQSVTLAPDSVYELKHSLNTKRLLVVAADSLGKKIRLNFAA